VREHSFWDDISGRHLEITSRVGLCGTLVLG